MITAETGVFVGQAHLRSKQDVPKASQYAPLPVAGAPLRGHEVHHKLRPPGAARGSKNPSPVHQRVTKAIGP